MGAGRRTEEREEGWRRYKRTDGSVEGCWVMEVAGGVEEEEGGVIEVVGGEEEGGVRQVSA